MKTTVIQLESHDDLISIKDKISWSKSSRLVLVWPKREKHLSGPLELKLIKRAANALGSELAIVSQHTVIVENARALGIPVFRSVPLAQIRRWRIFRGSKAILKDVKGYSALFDQNKQLNAKNKRKEFPVVQKLVAMLLSICAILALLVYIVPSANITLHPQTKTQTVDIVIIASPEMSDIALSGSIPALKVNIEISGELTGISSGSVQVPVTKAEGEIVFTNLLSDEVIIPKGTVLGTTDESGPRFITQIEAALPKGIKSTVTASVEASAAGESGNIKAGTINFIEGEIGSSVEVTNLEPFTGGTSQNFPAPTDLDYQKLRKQLTKELGTKAETSFLASVNQGQELIKESISVEEIVLQNQVNKIDEPSDISSLAMTVRYSALVFESSDIVRLATQILDQSMASDYKPVQDSLKVIKIGAVKIAKDGKVEWTIQAERKMTHQWDAQKLAVDLSGMHIDKAIPLIEKIMPQSDPPDIHFFIKAWRWIPFLPSQITFKEVVS